MKKLIMIPKNEEKGSVTLFVLIGSIFILIILLLVNVGLINNKANHEKQIDEISKKYSVNENDLEQAYQTVSSSTKNYMSKDEVEELVQQKINDFKNSEEEEKTQLQNKITDLENKLKESEVETVLYSGPKTVLDFGASTIVNLSDDLTKYKNLRLTFWTNVEYAEMTINVDNFVKNKDKHFMHYLQTWNTALGNTNVVYQSCGSVKYASDTSIQVIQAFNNVNWRLSLVEVVGVGQR